MVAKTRNENSVGNITYDGEISLDDGIVGTNDTVAPHFQEILLSLGWLCTTKDFILAMN